MSEPSKRILFSVSSTNHILNLKPIVDWLKSVCPGLQCDVISTTEFHRKRSSERELLSRIFNMTWVIDDYLPISFTLFDKLYEYQARRKNFLANSSIYFTTIMRFRRILKKINSYSAEKLIDNILKAESIKCVVLSNDRSFPLRELATWARRYGIRSLLIQESIRKDEIFERTKGISSTHPSTGLHGQGGCDRIAAWGITSQEYFVSVGVEQERIAITGSPRIDDLVAKYGNVSRDELRRIYQLPDNVRTILFATNPLYKMKILSIKDYISSLRTVVSSLQPFDGKSFMIVKPHQIEVEHQEWGLDEELDALPHVRYLRDITLGEAISLADAVMIFNSTVAVEAALFQKPVGVVNLFGVDTGVNFGESDFAVELKNPDEIQTFISGVYPTDWNFDGTHVDDFITNIGGAAESIGNEILKLARIG